MRTGLPKPFESGPPTEEPLSRIAEYDHIWYETSTGAAFCSNPYTKGSFKLNDNNSVLQMEIVGIAEGAKGDSILTSKSINIQVDRQAAIKATRSINTKSHCLRLCNQAIARL